MVFIPQSVDKRHSTRFYVGFIDFNRNRTLDQIKGKHEAKSLLPTEQYALQSLQRAMFHAHLAACLQVGVGLGAHSCHQSILQRLDLLFRDGHGLSIAADQPDNPRQIQNPTAIAQVKAYEDISRKQNQVQFFAAIFPSPHAAIDRQKTTDPPFL